MPNIDDLSISVKSNVTSATNSIDKLITKLGALSASLGQVNTSGFSAMASGIRQIENATKGISGNSAKNITELSLAIRKFGGKASTQAAANIPQLGNSLMQLSNSMASVGGMSFNTEGITNLASAINKLGGVKSSTAVQNIPQLTVALQGMVGSLNQIGTAGTSIFALGQLASSLSKLGGKTVTNALTNIPQLTNALMQMMSTLSKAPQVSYNVIQLVNSMANLASQGSKVGTASNSLYNGFMRFGKGADHARKKSFSLASAIGKLYASYFLLFRLFRGIGKGIDLASSLTEVQNVVDVSFGQYRDKIEDFASTSIQDYGMSELTAKQIASRYQAMGGAIGFAQDEMADMSITLTKLAADMASFYNVEQAAVAEDLEAIFTGQTRPLRTYGVDLTQASMQSWLLTKGIETNIAALTQQEKVLLRYNYVLEKTGMAQNDFQRTSGSWANQIRILRQQFEALSAIIGQNFVYALKPLVSALNTVMGKLIQFARVVSDSLGTIFGWKYEVSGGGLLNNEIENVEDFSAGLSGASDKAKKLKQQLQGFDELNVLTTNTPSSGGAGGGGVSDLPQASYGQWVPTDDDEGFFSSELDTLYKLGEYISTTLTDQLRSIDWQEVYQGAKDFGFGLADFLNGLISPDLFGATGRTIAGALNTAIYSSLGFGTEFDFDEFGSSIAQGVNEFFDEFDFTAFGQNIVTWVKGLKESLLVAIAEIEWGDVLAGIGDILKSLDAETIATLFAFGTISSLFKSGLFGALGAGLRGVTTLPAGLVTGLAGLSSLIFKGFVASLTTAFAGFSLGQWIAENTKFDEGAEKVIDWIIPSESWGRSFDVEAELKFQDTVNDAKRYIKKFENKTGVKVTTDNQIALSLITKKGQNIAASTKMLEALGFNIENLSTNGVKQLELLSQGSEESMQNMSSNIENAFTFFTDNIIGDRYTRGVNNALNTTRGLANSMASDYKKMSDTSTDAMNSITDNAIAANKKANESIRGIANDITNGVGSNYRRMATNINSSVAGVTSSISSQFMALRNNTNSTLSALNTETSNRLGTVRDTSNTRMGEIVSGANQRLGQLPSTIGNHMITANKKVQSYSWYSSGINLVDGLKNGISDQWSGNLYNKITDLASNLTSKLKKAFGIKSPSRLWRDEIGYYLTQGLEVGILGEEGHLSSSIVSMGARLTNTMSGALTLATPSSLSSNYDFGVTSTMAHNFTADGSMAGNIAQGVRDGVYSAQAEQNALLREQNNLLLQILNKEGISMDDVYSGVVNRNRDNINRTGLNPMMAY